MHKYLKDHVKEEIEGAIDYLEKAIELKKTNPEWAAKFFKMSDMEIEHANCMTKMFNSAEKPDNVTAVEFSAMQKELIDAYTSSMSKIEGMKKLYWNA